MRRTSLPHAAHHDERHTQQRSHQVAWQIPARRACGGCRPQSFFAVAESPNGVDNFRFWPKAITMPEDVIPASNVYDMRLTAHEDGWIYGVFCAERHDDSQPGDLSAATATAGIARTKDLINWERLPDLKSKSQRAQRRAAS